MNLEKEFNKYNNLEKEFNKYNFEVSEFHTYFVYEHGVWVAIQFPNGLTPAEAKVLIAQAYRQWASVNVGEIGKDASDAAVCAESIIKVVNRWIDGPRS